MSTRISTETSACTPSSTSTRTNTGTDTSTGISTATHTRTSTSTSTRTSGGARVRTRVRSGPVPGYDQSQRQGQGLGQAQYQGRTNCHTRTLFRAIPDSTSGQSAIPVERQLYLITPGGGSPSRGYVDLGLMWGRLGRCWRDPRACTCGLGLHVGLLWVESGGDSGSAWGHLGVAFGAVSVTLGSTTFPSHGSLRVGLYLPRAHREAEVETELANDTAVYKENKQWCDSSIAASEAAVQLANDRDQQLMTQVETSTQTKAQLEVWRPKRGSALRPGVGSIPLEPHHSEVMGYAWDVHGEADDCT